MMTIKWNRVVDAEHNAARMIFDQLRQMGQPVCRLSDRAALSNFDDAGNGFCVLSPPERIPATSPSTSPSNRRRCFNIRKKSNLDSVDLIVGGKPAEVFIPDTHGSCYWAILRYMYENSERPVAATELCEGVRAIMMERNPAKWLRFEESRRINDGPDQVGQKSVAHWQDRLVRNARNLCRLGGVGANGQRLVEADCPTCGYDLRASPDRCPECGTAIPAKAGS